MDLSPLLRAAAELPQCSFVLVGQIEGSAQLRRLSALPNVHLLGPKAPVELPDYLCRFDVCLNLLSGRELPTDIIPSRIYEYLSTGNPIVSMIGSGQIEHFPDVIYGAHTAREFSQLCASALTEVGSWTRCRRRTTAPPQPGADGRTRCAVFWTPSGCAERTILFALCQKWSTVHCMHLSFLVQTYENGLEPL